MRQTLANPFTMSNLDSARAQVANLGYCVIEDALSPDLLQRLRHRVVEQAAGERMAGVANLEYNGANQRIWMLPNKGAVFHELLVHPLIGEMMTPLLGRHYLLSSLTSNI